MACTPIPPLFQPAPSSTASLLLGSSARVPGAASMLAIPLLGEVPSQLQGLGIVAVVTGLLLAFGAARLLLSRCVQATP